MASKKSKDARNGRQLYNRVAVLRVERGLSRQQLADAIGVNFQTIGYLERGDYKASLELAFRLTEFFKLPLSAIFSREPFRPMSDELYQTSSFAERDSSSVAPKRVMKNFGTHA